MTMRQVWGMGMPIGDDREEETKTDLTIRKYNMQMRSRYCYKHMYIVAHGAAGPL